MRISGMRSFSLVVALVCASHVVSAQGDSLASFYPLAVGNIWQYRSYGSSSGVLLWTVEVVKETVLSNGKSYSRLHSSRPNVMDIYERLDSSDMTVYRAAYGGVAEYAIDSLRSDPGDIIGTSRYGEVFGTMFDGIAGDTILGVPTTTRNSNILVIPDFPLYKLARGFGLCYFSILVEDSNYPSYYRYEEILQYAKIDGNEFGTLLGVNEGPYQPKAHRLAQNYPNPFNPATTIAFDLPSAGHTRLSIVDILGREVAVLVDDVLSPGMHRRTWDASGRPSGIYLFRLASGGRVEIGKMTLAR